MIYIETIREKFSIKYLIYDTILVFSFSFLIAISSRVVIPLSFTPVPITMQTFSVLLSGALLGSKKGTFSVILYIVGGVIGLPFFAKGNSGLLYLGRFTGYKNIFYMGLYPFIIGDLIKIVFITITLSFKWNLYENKKRRNL